jgi:hypothetical protein
MRKYVIPSLLGLILFSSAATGQDCGGLCGTWELVSMKWKDAEGNSGENTAADLPTMKVINHTHFSLTRNNADGSFDGHAGRYKLEGDYYTEQIQHASNPYLKGQSFTFETRLTGDIWRISGSVGDLELEEVWRRIGTKREGS